MRLKQLALLCLLISTSIRANAAVVNGSFETSTVPPGNFTDFLGGAAAITGWTVTGVDVAIVSGTFQSSGITFQAQ
jgi:Mn2+/Fe2+ NRAMP family transporter